ncbi:MAG: glycosyl hydrolase 108 family protein [Spirosomataceae bacterium]
MASFTIYANKLLPLEGGYHYDNGKHSSRGITLATYRAWRLSKGISTTTIDDIKRITISEAKEIYKTWYWDALMGDFVKNQAVAEIMVDGKVNGGFSLVNLQKQLGIMADGKMGAKTLAAINQANQAKLHAKLLADRKAHYANLIRAQPQKYAQYKNGWANRLNNFVFEHSSEIGAGTIAIGLLTAYFLFNTKRHG